MYFRSYHDVVAYSRNLESPTLPPYDLRQLASMPARKARAYVYRLVRIYMGVKDRPKLLTENTIKIDKSNKLGIELSCVMHLSPADTAKVGCNTCPQASRGCKLSCLTTTGQGHFEGSHRARILKTRMYYEHRDLFLAWLWYELHRLRNKARKAGMSLAVRLNGTSDIPWERKAPWLFTEFGDVEFYDYTKIPGRLKHRMPDNYRLCLSRTETNDAACVEMLRNGGTVAAIFEDLPRAMADGWHGFKVIDGVNDDRRFDDPAGVVVGLEPLGAAADDTTGFVIRNRSEV